MANNSFKSNSKDVKKLHIGCSDIILVDYENIDKYYQNPNVIKSDYIDLDYSDNSIEEIIIRNAISQLKFSEYDLFFSELKRILIPNSYLIIYFKDFNNLFEQYRYNKIEITDVNDILFSNDFKNKSCIDKKTLFSILNKHNFNIVGFESENKESWDDFNCIIKAINQKDNSSSYDNNDFGYSKADDGIFEGINFDMQESNEDDELGNFDIDLFNEVMSTTKHPDTLDYDLLAEVMNFSPESGKYNSKESMNKSNVNVNDDKLLNNIRNFNFNSHDITETNTKNSIDDLFEEVLNFDVSSNNYETKNDLKDDYNSYKIEDRSENTKINNPLIFIKENTNKPIIEPSINLVWEGSQFVYNESALVNREICSKLIEFGTANLTIVPFEQDDINFSRIDTNVALLENDIRRKKEVNEKISKLPYTWVRNQFPPKSEPPKGAKWIIMQTWSYSLLTKELYSVLSKADEIWVPSFFTRKAMLDSGLNFNKVQVIPFGVNPDIFTPFGDTYPLPTTKKFKFLYVGDTNDEKGFDIVINSFLEAFNSDDNVALVIKENISNNGKNYKEFINSQKWSIHNPEIIYIDDKLTVKEMASLYRSCDVLVSPYRTSGFGLSIIEAISSGLPVIATKGGPSDEYLEEAFAFLISSEIKYVGSNYNGKEFNGNVSILEPSFLDFKNQMLDIFSNPGNLKSMGIIGSAYIRTKWNWQISAIKALRRLDYHYNTKMSSQAEEYITDSFDDASIFGTAEHSFISGDHENSVDLYMQSIRGNIPDRYKILALHRIALILINRNDNFAALDILNSITQIAYNHPDSKYLEVIISASEKNNIEALEKISPLMDSWNEKKFSSDLGHNLDDLLVLTADLLFAINEIESAHSLYTTALSMNDQNSFACYGVGMCFKISEIYDEAEKMFRWALELNPEFEEAKRELTNL